MATTSRAAGYVKTADRAGETAASTQMDKLATDAGITPTLDPASFVKQSTGIYDKAYKASGVEGALSRTRASGEAATAALDFVAEKYKQDELKRVPLESMDKEVQRLIQMKFRVLPDMLARTDIVDYNARIRLANQLVGVYDSEINEITSKKQTLEQKASERAALKVGELQASASVLDKRFQNDQAELNARLSLFKDGRGSLQDILEAAVSMAESRSKVSGSGNPWAGGGDTQGFSDAEISAFLYYEANNEFPINSTASQQERLHITDRYRKWASAGKPGTKMTKPGNNTPLLQQPGLDGAGYYGAMNAKPETTDIENPYIAPAQNQANKNQQLLKSFLEGLPK